MPVVELSVLRDATSKLPDHLNQNAGFQYLCNELTEQEFDE